MKTKGDACWKPSGTQLRSERRGAETAHPEKQRNHPDRFRDRQSVLFRPGPKPAGKRLERIPFLQERFDSVPIFRQRGGNDSVVRPSAAHLMLFSRMADRTLEPRAVILPAGRAQDLRRFRRDGRLRRNLGSRDREMKTTASKSHRRRREGMNGETTDTRELHGGWIGWNSCGWLRMSCGIGARAN